MTDWQVGDLAVCVDARPNPKLNYCELVEGRSYRVTGVRMGELLPHALYGQDYGLAVDGARSRGRTGFFAMGRFRKILPDKHEACEDEFAILLKLSKQRVKA